MAQASGSTYDVTCKILLVGVTSAGKSELLLTYTGGSGSDVDSDPGGPNCTDTIGIDFKIKRMELNGHVVKLIIFDTRGQERYRALDEAYFRGTDGCMLVYDVCDRASHRKWRLGLLAK